MSKYLLLLCFCAVWAFTNAAPMPDDLSNTVQAIVPVQSSPVVVLESDDTASEGNDLEVAEAAHYGYGGGGFGHGGGFGGGYGGGFGHGGGFGGGFGFRKFGGFGGGFGHHGFGGGFPGHGLGGFGGGGGGGFIVGGGFIKGGGFYGKK